MKSALGMLPWAIVLGAAGFGIWWLLSREMTAGKWALAALLVGHGIVHVFFLTPSPAPGAGGPEWPFRIDGSWPAGLGLDAGLLRVVGAALIAVAIASFAVAAASTVGIVVPASWWPGAVAVGAVVSAATLVLFFDLQLVLGLAIDAVLLWVVAAGAWRP
jgi:hypothetical protein